MWWDKDLKDESTDSTLLYLVSKLVGMKVIENGSLTKPLLMHCFLSGFSFAVE